jgi:hypothetical protein
MPLSNDNVNTLLLTNTIGWDFTLYIKLKGDEYESQEDWNDLVS